MAIFAIVGVANPDLVKDRLEKHFAGSIYVAGERVFFVAAAGRTTREIGEMAGLSPETDATRGIVLSVTSYWGFHDRELWEWMQVKHNA